jgi:hypothetical protein
MKPERPHDRTGLLRGYAMGEVTWRQLRERGFDTYLEVLAGLGELGLRPPIAPLAGPNRAARERGRAIIREALLDEAAKSGRNVDLQRQPGGEPAARTLLARQLKA